MKYAIEIVISTTVLYYHRFLGVKLSQMDIQFSWFTSEPLSERVCGTLWLTEIGLLEGKRVDLYELPMIRQGDIRVTGVLAHPPHGHCVEEKC